MCVNNFFYNFHNSIEIRNAPTFIKFSERFFAFIHLSIQTKNTGDNLHRIFFESHLTLSFYCDIRFSYNYFKLLKTVNN